MQLFTLLEGMMPYELFGADCQIDRMTIDSRQVEPGSLFVCLKGLVVDGHHFMQSAIEKGAVAIVCETLPEALSPSVTYVKVPNSRKALGLLSANFFLHPAEQLKKIGVTGTNGKTSTTYFLEQMLSFAKKNVGIIGTTGAYVNTKPIDIGYATSTTPDPIELHAIFAEMVKENVEYLAIEVTSHALALQKTYGITFEYAIFTNFTQDHLDFHGNLNDYLAAKAKLFSQAQVGIFNADDKGSVTIMERSPCKKVTYGIEKPADYKAENVLLLNNSISFDIDIHKKTYHMQVPIAGKFNVYNILSCIACCSEMGIAPETIGLALATIKGVPGRFQTVANPHGFAVLVDYAHSPDSLSNIIAAVRGITTGRVITVFGCGGDRDQTKRPIMGEIVGHLSDYCIITTDNPRSEVPEDIIAQVEKGTRITGCDYQTITDRKEAIFAAIAMAQPGDSVILAGKGHETYQEFENKRRIHFDDCEVAQAALQDWKKTL